MMAIPRDGSTPLPDNKSKHRCYRHPGFCCWYHRWVLVAQHLHSVVSVPPVDGRVLSLFRRHFQWKFKFKKEISRTCTSRMGIFPFNHFCHLSLPLQWGWVIFRKQICFYISRVPFDSWYVFLIGTDNSFCYIRCSLRGIYIILTTVGGDLCGAVSKLHHTELKNSKELKNCIIPLK